MTAPLQSWQGQPITDDLVLSCIDARYALIGIQADRLRDRWARNSEAYFARSPAAVESHALPGSSTTETVATTAGAVSTRGEGL